MQQRLAELCLPLGLTLIFVIGVSWFSHAEFSGPAGRLPAGSVSAPSLTFGSDGTTGLFAPAAGQVEISASGANVLDYGATTASYWTFGAGVIVPSASPYAWLNRSDMFSPSNGNIELTNASGDGGGFSLLQLGGTTASFGAIKRIGNTIAIRQANDSVGTVANLTACSSSLEGGLAAVTDATSTSAGTTVAGSGTHHDLVYCNGTNWIVVVGT